MGALRSTRPTFRTLRSTPTLRARNALRLRRRSSSRTRSLSLAAATATAANARPSFIGRAGQVEDNISGNGDCSTCTSDRNVIADVRQVGAVSSSSNVQQVEFIVPMCDCDDDDTFVDPCLVCDADEFATLNAKIDAVRASVAAASSNQLSAIDDLEDDISKVDKNVDG